MSSNGRPNLEYSNLFWSNIDREQRAQIFNREELIREILSEPEPIEPHIEPHIELPVDRLQLSNLSDHRNQGEINDKTSSNQGIETIKINQHGDAKDTRYAV